MMKYLFLAFAFILSSLCAFGQTEESGIYKTIHNEYLDKDFQITYIGKALSKDNYFLFQAFNTEDNSNSGIFFTNSKQWNSFILDLQSAKTKYVEWIATAKGNNVSELDKKLPISTKGGSYKHGVSFFFNRNCGIEYYFSVKMEKDNIKYLLSVQTPYVISSNNQFVYLPVSKIIFETPEEIDNYIQQISYNDFENYLKNKTNQQEIFK